MVRAPEQRPSRTWRTVTLADPAALRDALVVAAATGWHVWAAHRRRRCVELVLTR